MTSNGELLDPYYDTLRDTIYPLFVKYFGNPEMTKIKNVKNYGDDEEYSMYMCKIHALLISEFRYIIVFIFKDDLPIGSKVNLEALPWMSLQTRTMQEEHDLPLYSYIPRRLAMLDKKISLVKQDERSYTYHAENSPIVITLLAKMKDTTAEYPPTGTVCMALETYQTVVTWR